MEAAREAAKAKDEEIAALGFSKDSKQGRLLIARVRSLIKENEELGEQVSAGRVHQLSAEVALLRDYVGELKRAYAELEETAALADEENEELQACTP